MVRHRNLPVELPLDGDILGCHQFSDDRQAAGQDAVGPTGNHECSFIFNRASEASATPTGERSEPAPTA
jgi:hypothetical protein